MRNESRNSSNKLTPKMHRPRAEEVRHRPTSAPPVEKVLIEDMSVKAADIPEQIWYAAFYRRNSRSEPRLPPPCFFMLGQSSYVAPESRNVALIAEAFSNPFGPAKKNGFIQKMERKGGSLLERIDEDHPLSEKNSEYRGPSRTSTPIGDSSMMSPILNSISTKEMLKGCYGTYSDSEEAYTSDSEDFLPQEEANVLAEDIQELAVRLPGGMPKLSACVELSRDQEGSRFIQKRLEGASAEEKAWFFREIKDQLLELITDLFGNYVIQKLFDLCSEGQRAEMIALMEGRIVALSFHMYGCRVIQKALDTMDDIGCIVEELKGAVMDLIEDQNGNHVVQKCVERINNKGFIVNVFEIHANKLAKHRYGCRVIQRLFENCAAEECAKMVAAILDSTEDLIENQYGNYVIQHIIEHGRPEDKGVIISKIFNRAYELSTHKFASNVIEKCVVICSSEERDKFLDSFLLKRDERPYIFYMCQDKFANYVVQRLLEVLDAKKKALLVSALRPYIVDLKKSVYAKHILSKIM